MMTPMGAVVLVLVGAKFWITAHGQNNELRGPTFVQEPSGRLDFSNSSGAVVRCSATGNPSPSIHWETQAGRKVEDIPGLRHTRADGSLVFPPFKAEDYRQDIHSSVYRCIASNQVGTVGSRDVHTRAVVDQSFEVSVFDEFVISGNMALFTCHVPPFYRDHVQVTSWERSDGIVIVKSAMNGKYWMLQSGQLYIRDVDRKDAKHGFRCHVENMLTGSRKVSMNYGHLQVTEPHASQPLRMTMTTGRVVVTEGQPAELLCLGQGSPPPTYSWYRHVHGQWLPLGRDDRRLQRDGVLLFRQTIPRDSGKYMCVANNSIGRQDAENELVVYERLRATIHPSRIRLNVGETAVLNCSTIPGMETTIVWRRNMQPLAPSPRTQYLSPSIFQLGPADRQVAGMYQCFVYRDMESAQAAAEVAVGGDQPPVFKEVFSEVTVKPGSFVSLKCLASGNPLPKITWTLDGMWPLAIRTGVQVNDYVTASGDIVSYANVSLADVKESGLYSCIATNFGGSVKHSARLNIYGPLFIRPLSNLSVLAGDLSIVHCPFGGYPFDELQWERDGRRLPLNQRQKVFPNGTLLIADVQREEDEGKYTCVVSSRSGQSAVHSVERTLMLIVRTGPHISPLNFQRDLHEGMRTAVTCVVVAGDPPIYIKWYKDGRSLRAKELDVTAINGEDGFVSTLSFKKLTHAHNGNYTCTASNDVATVSQSALLMVKVPPRWQIEPVDTAVIAGKSLMIDCQADGVPQPYIRWKIAVGKRTGEYKTIISSSHLHILVNGSLNIRSAEESDAGFYLCEANNGVGSGLSAVVQVTVNTPPSFSSKYFSQASKKGESVEIKCAARGNQPISFMWQKNGVPFDPATEHRYSISEEVHQSGSTAILSIRSVDRRDTAVFNCIAKNEYGEDATTIQLTVQDVPEAPENVEAKDIGTRSVRLSWLPPYTGNLLITQYIIEWQSSSSAEWQLEHDFLSVPGNENTAVIRNLEPGVRYVFRMRAENDIGRSPLSPEVVVVTLEEPPQTAPTRVEAVATGSQVVEVTWDSAFKSDSKTKIEGYYIGYKSMSSLEPFTYKTLGIEESSHGRSRLTGLQKSTDYIIVVQAFNSKGAGPPSEEVLVRTMDYDPPRAPFLKVSFTNSTTIGISWETDKNSDAPITGYVLNQKREGSEQWQETHISSDKSNFVLSHLHCGTRYDFYLYAFNGAGKGDPSEIVQARTTGGAPVAPERKSLMTVNSTYVIIHLNSWQSSGCPIAFFVVQYKPEAQREWMLLSNNIIPEQRDIIISELLPGSWYSLLMTAHNDAGYTDAEYLFATLTTTGEFPPPPSESSDSTAMLYRHLTVTVPAVCSFVVLSVVFVVVCLVTKKRGNEGRSGSADCNDTQEHIKPDSMALSVSYDTSQEPAYFPAPYATSNVHGYSRDQCGEGRTGIPSGLRTFTNSQGGHTYDVPMPPKKNEKGSSRSEKEFSYNSGVVIDSNLYVQNQRPRQKARVKRKSKREDGDGLYYMLREKTPIFAPTRNISCSENDTDSDEKPIHLSWPRDEYTPRLESPYKRANAAQSLWRKLGIELQANAGRSTGEYTGVT